MASNEARELSLVSKVELRIALAETESVFQSILMTYLPPLLLKLESEHVDVRNKVISVCQHVNTRIQAPNVVLPVLALLKQFKDHHNPLIRHFDLLYIQKGVERLSDEAHVKVLQELSSGFAELYQESKKHAAAVFNLFLRLLPSLTLPPRGSKGDHNLRAQFGFDRTPADSALVADCISKLTMFSTSRLVGERCPGLSIEDCQFLQQFGNDRTWDPAKLGGLKLNDTKLLALRFVDSGAFTEAEQFFPALLATADTAGSRLTDLSEDMMKRAAPVVSLEDRSVVDKLFDLYLGSSDSVGPLPVRVPVQIKILGLLSKSKVASTYVPRCLEVVRQALGQKSLDENVHNNQALPSVGREMSKFRSQVFAFVNWLARISSSSDKKAFAPKLVSQIRGYIEDQGWPRPRSGNLLSDGELTSRAYGYESIGLMAGASPEELLIEPSFELLRWLMTSLSEDPSKGDNALSIDHALSNTLAAFKQPLPTDLEAPFASLFLHHARLKLRPEGETSDGVMRSTTYVALRFVNRVLPFSSIDARYIDVLALCADKGERQEVRDEGRKGLHPHWNLMLNPNFEANSLSVNSRKVTGPMLPDIHRLVDRLLGSESAWKLDTATRIDAFAAAISLCRCTFMHQLLHSLGSDAVVDAEWERNIDAIIQNDEHVRSQVYENVTHALHEDAGLVRTLEILARACFDLHTTSDSNNAVRGGFYLIEICSLLPATVYNSLTKHSVELRGPIFSSNEELRRVAAHVFGLLGSSETARTSQILDIEDLRGFHLSKWKQAVGSQVYEVHGSLLAEAYYLSRSWQRGVNNDHVTRSYSTLTATMTGILLESKDKTLQDAAILAISQLALYQLPPECVDSLNDPRLVQRLFEQGKSGSEKAVTAIGHLALQRPEAIPELESREVTLDRIYELHEVRHAEVQFAVGEALSCAALGWESRALVSALDIPGSRPRDRPQKATLSRILDRLFSDCKSSKPALRQAVVIWLLCLVQFGGHVQTVQARFRHCQLAFKSFLADREAINQECAARGLNLIYEKGGQELKAELVKDLVASFTGSTPAAVLNVSEDTELFDEGALPTGDSSVRTYKDILSLASEVGDSSLVYRFMSLASHDAIWSSRAAFGRFGLSKILNDAGTDTLVAQNAKLYPALFRYRFDPNTNVRRAMNDIWSSLVRNPSDAIKEHFDAIMKDLLKNILGKEWRTRQACCAALADLVQARGVDAYEGYLSEIWSCTFKVCDDIKETVRSAAMSLARVLTGILTRALEGGDSSARAADAMLKQVIPFLLGKQGLESSSQDVQQVSRKVIVDVIKKGHARTVRPFVPELVSQLLALLSSIEPEMINYVHMNAEQYGLTKQELDDARLKHIRGSSMLEAIEKCLDYLDESSMPDLVERLQNTITTVIGLPSKVGCSRVLVTLATRQNLLFKPYTDQFLQLARKQVLDRNDTISSAYAAACGYLARLASDEALARLIARCRELYFEAEDERHRTISGDIMNSFSKYATDRFKSFAGETYPFIFVAKHDEASQTKALFDNAWNDNVGGSRTVLLYLREIMDLLVQNLDSARWSIKHTSALAVASVIQSAGTNISISDAQAIWPALEKALSGKTWSGKEEVLRALVLMAQRSSLVAGDTVVGAQMWSIMVRESKRNNMVYRQHAFPCLADYVQVSGVSDHFQAVYDIVTPVITDLLVDDDDMDIDIDGNKTPPKVLKQITLAGAYSALLRAIPRQDLAMKSWEERLTSCLSFLEQASTAEGKSRRVQVSVLEALGPVFHALAETLETPSATFENKLCDYARYLENVGDQIEEVRLKAAESAAELAGVLGKGPLGKGRLRQTLESRLHVERSSSVKQALEVALRKLEAAM